MASVLVTGASGFVGRALCRRLQESGWMVRGTLLPQEAPSTLPTGVQPVMVETLGCDTEWGHALADIDVVVHLAARVHVMQDAADDPLQEYRRVNVAGTERLAREAARTGVKRVVFISSIKVNGEESPVPYTESSSEEPSDPYGKSKLEAEQALRRIEGETGLEVVIVRPPLVYGPGVKANFLNMMKVISKGMPLPLASLSNRRSLIFVGNLADVLALCARHPSAAGKTYLVNDGEDLSTPELVRRTGEAMSVPVRLFPCPVAVLRMAGRLTGKSGAIDRLAGSLMIDSTRIRRELGWNPPFSVFQGLRLTADWYSNRPGDAA